MKLNTQRMAFCRAFATGMTSKEAAIKAGYSVRSADRVASRLINYPDVKDYISELLKKHEFGHVVTVKRVTDELARRAFYDPAEFFKEVVRNGRTVSVPKRIHELTRAQRSAIDTYDPSRKYVRLADKDASLDKLSKHLKMYTDLDQQQTHFVLMPVLKIGNVPVEFNVGTPVRRELPKEIK